jgi:hypothetical protein
MTPILGIDDAYDRDYAADGISRFGGYVRQRAHLFADDWEPLSPVTFACTVWSIATGPVMVPGYVRVRQGMAVRCAHGEEPGVLIAEVGVRLPWPPGLRAELRGWSSWQLSQGWGDEEPGLVDPPDDRPTLLIGASVRVPIAEKLLPTPSRFAALDVGVAKRAVALVCQHVNEQAGPVVELLRTNVAIGAHR